MVIEVSDAGQARSPGACFYGVWVESQGRKASKQTNKHVKEREECIEMTMSGGRGAQERVAAEASQGPHLS